MTGSERARLGRRRGAWDRSSRPLSLPPVEVFTPSVKIFGRNGKEAALHSGMQRSLASGLLVVLCLCSAPGALAGGAPEPRKHFKQGDAYPYIFRAEPYLATHGPVQMRFGGAAPECPERFAPPLLQAPKPEAKPKADVVENGPDKPGKEQGGAAQPQRDLNLKRIPDELMEFFSATEGRPVTRSYLFDPIFQPALPV